jgi:copper chaperone CopZ
MRLKLICLGLVIAIVAGCGTSPTTSVSSDGRDTMAVAFNVSGAPTVEFSVPDMMCPESCAVQVKEILSEQPGAKEVVVDFDSKTATVAIDKDKFDPDAAIAALVDHMYDHSQLKSTATN